MPTYQYACTNPECGNRFELVQSFTDPAASVCPVCDGPVRKVFSAVGVVFKGSGFYRNDSREAAKNGAGKKKETSDTGTTKGESSTSAKSSETSNGKSAASESTSSSSESSSTSSTSSTSSSSPSPSPSKPPVAAAS